MRALKWILVTLMVSMVLLFLLGDFLCSCTIVLTPSPDSPLGQTATAVANAQDSIYRRTGRYALSEDELAAELARVRLPVRVYDVEVLLPSGPEDPEDHFLVRFETDYRLDTWSLFSEPRNAFCRVWRRSEPVDSARKLEVSC